MHVLFFNHGAIGHLTPTVSLVEALTRRGHQVTYWVSQMPQGLPSHQVVDRLRNSSKFEVIEEMIGEKFDWMGRTKPGSGMQFGCVLFDRAAVQASSVLPRVRDIMPDLIVYCPFYPLGSVVGRALGIPAVATVSWFLLSKLFLQTKSEPAFLTAAAAIKKETGVDVIADMADELGLLCTPKDLNLVFSSKSLVAPAVIAAMEAENAKFVGPVFSNIPKEEFDQVQEFVDFANGRRIVYASFGTMVSPKFPTLKPFLIRWWQTLFAVAAEMQSEIVVVVSFTQNEYDAMFDLVKDVIPSNVITRSNVAQRALLTVSSAFVSHGGCNSFHEAQFAGVPLIMVPFFGDQHNSAAAAERCGFAVTFPHSETPGTPWDASAERPGVSAETIRAALTSVLGEGMQAAASRAQEKLQLESNTDAVIDIMLEHAAVPRCKALL